MRKIGRRNKKEEIHLKRAKNLYPKIVDRENIRLAIYNASKMKKNRKDVQRVLDNVDYYIEEIHNMLVNKTYVPSPYTELKILDGSRKKVRIICKPAFYPDQIIHWAVLQIIQPLLERGMYELCCASVPGRGIHYAARYVQKILVQDRKNTKYCLSIDIHHFYASIVHIILIWKLRKIIKDEDTMDLLILIILCYKYGLPIGFFTSQWLANYYLQDLDHYIKEVLKVPYFVRYMDDMLLFHRNKKELHKIKEQLEQYLKMEGLEIKDNWQLFKVDSRPIDFIGYRFYRGYTTLRRSNFLRIKRRIKKIYKKGTINSKDAAAVISYRGWYKHCNHYTFSKKYVEPYININQCKGVIRHENI